MDERRRGGEAWRRGGEANGRNRRACQEAQRDLGYPLSGREVVGHDAGDGRGVEDKVEHRRPPSHPRPEVRAAKMHADKALEPARPAHRDAAQLPHRAARPVRTDDEATPHDLRFCAILC